MMKRMLIAACLLLLAAACGKDPEPGPAKADIVGEWQLTGAATKATVAGQTVNVYVAFTADGKFELYQQLGQGWYQYYSGTWALSDGNILSGQYSDGNPWGSEYAVEQNGNTMTLTTAAGEGRETDTYTKTTIPDSVKEMTEK